jgi:hypothetical protein
MPLKRIEECTLDDLFGLFDLELEDLTLEELKQAKKKVLLLHPDKNRGRDTSYYYEYFKTAYEKLEQVFEFINRHPKKSMQQRTYQNEELLQQGFYEYCQKHGLKDRAFQKTFNEVFEKVYLSDDTGYGEWLKSEEGVYEKGNLEGSRVKAMSLIVVDKELKTLQEVDPHDVKDAYLHSVLPIQAEKVYQETPRFSTVEEYQRHQAKSLGPPIPTKDAERLLRDKEQHEYKTSLQMSYDLLKKTENQTKRMKEVYSQFLKLENS